MNNIQITGYVGREILTFDDWEKYSLPPERRMRHWKEGRRAYELGRVWMAKGGPSVAPELSPAA